MREDSHWPERAPPARMPPYWPGRGDCATMATTPSMSVTTTSLPSGMTPAAEREDQTSPPIFTRPAFSSITVRARARLPI